MADEKETTIREVVSVEVPTREPDMSISGAMWDGEGSELVIDSPKVKAHVYVENDALPPELLSIVGDVAMRAVAAFGGAALTDEAPAPASTAIGDMPEAPRFTAVLYHTSGIRPAKSTLSRAAHVLSAALNRAPEGLREERHWLQSVAASLEEALGDGWEVTIVRSHSAMLFQ